MEQVKLMDLKIDPRTDSLYYKPVVGTSAQELQQMVKYDSREEITERNRSNLHTSSKYS